MWSYIHILRNYYIISHLFFKIQNISHIKCENKLLGNIVYLMISVSSRIYLKGKLYNLRPIYYWSHLQHRFFPAKSHYDIVTLLTKFDERIDKNIVLLTVTFIQKLCLGDVSFAETHTLSDLGSFLRIPHRIYRMDGL